MAYQIIRPGTMPPLAPLHLGLAKLSSRYGIIFRVNLEIKLSRLFENGHVFRFNRMQSSFFKKILLLIYK